MVFGLNIVELIVGFVIQLPLYYLIGNWVFLLCVMSAFLWALGGSGFGRAWRFLGVPTVASLMIWIFNSFPQIWYVYPALCLIASEGYGEKSSLWSFFYELTTNHQKADYLTRMVTYFSYWFVIGLSLIIFK